MRRNLWRDDEQPQGVDPVPTYGLLLSSNGAVLEGGVEWSGGPAIHFVTIETLGHELEAWEFDAVYSFFEAFGGVFGAPG